MYGASLVIAWLLAIAALWSGLETLTISPLFNLLAYGALPLMATGPIAILATVCLNRAGRAGRVSRELPTQLAIIAVLSSVLFIERHLILTIDRTRVDRGEDWMPGAGDVFWILALDLFCGGLFWAILAFVVSITHLECRYRD